MNKATIDALNWKADIADEETANDPEWAHVAAACRAAVADDTLRGHPFAVEEMENYLTGDLPPAEWRAIQEDLARAGELELFNPATMYYPRKPRMIVVDGKRYIAS